MDRATLSQRIESILNEITRLSNTLYAMDNTNIQRHSDNYEMLSTEAALRGEVIACRLRHLIYETTTIRKAEYLTSAGVMQGISVIEKDGILEITLPCLLPKKSKKHTLTDSNHVVSDYTFSSNLSDIVFTTNGNTLTITAKTAPAEPVTISASKNNIRKGVVVWSDGHYGPDGTMQDVTTYAATVMDPVQAFLNLKVSYGSAKIVKASEDGKVDK